MCGELGLLLIVGSRGVPVEQVVAEQLRHIHSLARQPFEDVGTEIAVGHLLLSLEEGLVEPVTIQAPRVPLPTLYGILEYVQSTAELPPCLRGEEHDVCILAPPRAFEVGLGDLSLAGCEDGGHVGQLSCCPRADTFVTW